jgi:hypothetical protein
VVRGAWCGRQAVMEVVSNCGGGCGVGSESSVCICVKLWSPPPPPEVAELRYKFVTWFDWVIVPTQNALSTDL